MLKTHLDELFAAYPALRVLTGHALFRQRLLAQAILTAGRVDVLDIKDNQPDLHEAARTAFAAPDKPAVVAREKTWRRGMPATLVRRGGGRLRLRSSEIPGPEIDPLPVKVELPSPPRHRLLVSMAELATAAKGDPVIARELARYTAQRRP